ncbi:sigma-70 family RNA polymerase sigma factor [Cellulomonas fimi]|uniref:Sigma-70 family RNA polymerase sigma factor n=1 Tax=Cellulomonas fimi TaxID=1708 RepID=A0A7Y0M0Y5_CELFI|nr:sigma-70 family RNA polymerase sigma factor [Cellulomonas fimi]NMR21028.1 sigma-70 family RNA polymerase sigma factor [Cellulomonas fimi]
MRNSPAEVDALVTANLPLVGYRVSELLGRVPAYVSRDELASAGSLALVQAAQAYDAETGVPFARYASLRIRGALLDELRAMDWVSRGARQRARRVSTTSDEMTSQLGRTPTREELATALGTDVAEVDAARGDAERRILSIEAFDSAIADTVTEPGMGPEESLLVNEKLQHLKAAVTALPERLRHVVEQLFFHDRPVVELAEELGVTQSRISQLRTEALALMKDGMNASLEPSLVPVAERPDGVAERRRKAYFDLVAQQASFLARASQLAAPGPGVLPQQRDEAKELAAAKAKARSRAGAAYATTA